MVPVDLVVHPRPESGALEGVGLILVSLHPLCCALYVVTLCFVWLHYCVNARL